MQDEAVEHVASTMERLMSESVNHRRLYLIQTYGIGKERVFIEVRPQRTRNLPWSAVLHKCQLPL